MFQLYWVLLMSSVTTSFNSIIFESTCNVKNSGHNEYLLKASNVLFIFLPSSSGTQFSVFRKEVRECQVLLSEPQIDKFIYTGSRLQRVRLQ